MNGNRFYVHPAGDILPGLQGLSVAFERLGQKREAQVEKERIERIKQNAIEAYQSGDPDRIAEYALQNPEISAFLTKQADFRSERTRQNFLDSAYSVIADPSEQNVSRMVNARQAFLRSQGQTDEDMPFTSTFLEKYKADPDKMINELKMDVAGLDPERWKKFREALVPTETGKDTRTSEIKNIEYYNELRQINPEMAEKFAAMTGISGKTGVPPTPTDIDDFVADADAESVRATGKPLTPGQRNEARLEFKRAQAKEMAANTWAERNVEAATAEKIKYNERIGTRLAEIATQADLMKAKGEISPIEKKMTARKRMEGNLATLVKHYLALDSMGAILNVYNTTFENIVAAMRASTVGQAFGRITGSEEQSIRSAIKKLKPILINDIRQATDMSARGLDSERELDFYLQAATNEKTDIQSNIAAIVVMDEAYGTGNVANYLRRSTDESLIRRISETGQLILRGVSSAEEIIQKNPENMTDEELEKFISGGE